MLCTLERNLINFYNMVYTLLSSNEKKLAEYKSFGLKNIKLSKGKDLREIKSDSPMSVIIYKSIEAGKGTLIEDTVLVINNKVVTDIRYKMKQLFESLDSVTILDAYWRVNIAYNDGNRLYISTGEIRGLIKRPIDIHVDAFGFDDYFYPIDGNGLSNYELESQGKKINFSARKIAIESFIDKDYHTDVKIENISEWTGEYQGEETKQETKQEVKELVYYNIYNKYNSIIKPKIKIFDSLITKHIEENREIDTWVEDIKKPKNCKWGCGLIIDLVTPNEPTKYLLGKRSLLANQANTWGFIGGSVEQEQNSDDAMVRECYEECNLIPNALKLIDIEGTDINNINFLYKCSFEDCVGNLKRQPSEISQLRWFTKEEIEELDLFKATKVSWETYKKLIK